MGKNKNVWQRFLDGVELIVSSYKASRGDLDAWERTIEKFEAQDRLEQPVKGSIVFVGSSSFTFWSTLEQDMAPLPVINRGFGGSRMRDVVKYVDRIVLPYHPRAVVLFAGTNDVVDKKPNPARQVFDGYLDFVKQVQAALPEVIVHYVAITPTPTRWRVWPIAAEANRLIREHAQNEPNLRFIDFTEELLGVDGKPDRSLYRFDGIHPNRECYAIWTAAIKPRLEEDLSCG
jgi:lysophospholipase L1-like esterase